MWKIYKQCKKAIPWSIEAIISFTDYLTLCRVRFWRGFLLEFVGSMTVQRSFWRRCCRMPIGDGPVWLRLRRALWWQCAGCRRQGDRMLSDSVMAVCRHQVAAGAALVAVGMCMSVLAWALLSDTLRAVFEMAVMRQWLCSDVRDCELVCWLHDYGMDVQLCG